MIPKKLGLSKSTWKLSATWLVQKLDCTPAGIVNRCHGACCRKFWPAIAKPQADGGCYYLTPTGCSLPETKRPITCLLYPLVLNKNNTLVRHFRAGIKNVTCYPNIGLGTERLYETFHETFTMLFGAAYDKSVLEAGRDLIVVVPPKITKQYKLEKQLQIKNQLPKPRKG